MTSCLMFVLTIFGIPIVLFSARQLFLAVRTAVELVRSGLPRPLLRPLAFAPACAATVLVILAVAGIGYGWKRAEPCGGPVARLSAPGPSALVCGVVPARLEKN